MWNVQSGFYERSFPCIDFIIQTPHFQLPSQLLTWMVSLFYTLHKYWVIRALITTRNTLFCWAKCWRKWLLPRLFNRKSLEYLHVLWFVRLCQIAQTCSSCQQKLTDKCSTLHCKRGRFLALLMYVSQKNMHLLYWYITGLLWYPFLYLQYCITERSALHTGMLKHWSNSLSNSFYI